ncbi:PREDICTED: A-kinase anchor protein 13 [Hipposideros armiger]|uniref:A-kinase anchor protein 13 n=1 Tax=Hipposideros armiger TaxID=186990 RepID=A0A8B7TAA3_HIPAR|nr:PREDICTED: A-kinase anchor protein 13 [Hipposideros armiger]
MKLKPQQAPLYGDCVVTVLLAEEDKVEDDVVFYLVFSGSTLHHCTSTRKVSSDTLETIAPGHNCCETVKVLLCASKEGLPVFVVAEEDFEFVQDEAYDAAQFLATCAGNQQALNFTRFLDRSGPPSTDVNSLDEKVALAFRHLKLPAEWNVLGTEQTLHDGGPRETLMHFAVRLGLLRLAWFLLQKPGGRGALSIHNQEGATPISLALERGYHKLHQLLTAENAGEPDSWSSLSYEIPYGDCSVRHHRELDVYTLTAESQAHDEHPLPGDRCTGHIFKLMNIQQQLMKTNLKQMDSLMPLMVTADGPSGLPTAQNTDGQCLSCAPMSPDGQQLSPPPADPGCPPCCSGSTAGQIESASDLSQVGKEEKKDCVSRKKKKGEEKKEEAEPTLTVDSGTVSDPGSCPQSMSECGGRGTGGLPSRGIRDEETGVNPAAVATDQASARGTDGVLPGVMILEPGTAPHGSGGELVVGSAGASAPETKTAGLPERGLLTPETTTQKVMPEVEESTKEALENSTVSTAAASEATGTGTSMPVDNATVPTCASATSSPGDHKPAESSLAVSNGENSIEKTAETETSRSCKEGAGALVAQNPLINPAAAKDKTFDGPEPGAPLANPCEAVSPSDVTFSRLQKEVMPSQKSDTNSSRVQSPNSKSPICYTTGNDELCAASAWQQGIVTSSGALAAGHPGDSATPSGSTPAGPPSTQHPPTVCSEGPQASTATPDPGRDTQEDVGFCPLQVPGKEGQGRDWRLETSLTNIPVAVPPPHAVVPKAEKEPGPGPAVTSGRTFSLASSPSSESVTKGDALSLVPSQKEKGTATPEPHRDCRDGRDSNDPEKPPLEASTAGLPASSPALDLQPSMGNSLLGFGGEPGEPCLSAAPEGLNIEGTTDSSILHVGKAPLVPDSSLADEGKNLVVLESSAARGKDDKVKAVICSSIKDDSLSSGTFQEEQRVAPPGHEAPGICGEPSSAACAEDKALEPCATQGTPLACLNSETKHSKEVAPPVSLLTEGGAAQSLVPPGASLAADLSHEARGAERSSSPLLQGGSEALTCNGSLALDVGVKNTQSQGKSPACEVSGNEPADVPVVDALQGAARAVRDSSCNAQGLPTPEVSLSQEKNAVRGLPGAVPDKGVTDLHRAASLEMVPLGWEKARLEGADRSCSLGDCEQAHVDDDDARHVPLQPVAEELPAETGPSPSDDRAPSSEGGGPPPPCTVSAEAGTLPTQADLIEEAASRIVDAVIERVKASGTLFTEGNISHMSPSSPEPGPGTEQLGSAFLPGETPHAGSVGEAAPGNLAGPPAGREEPQKMSQPVRGPEPATEMPDTKADDEVDFLSNTRENAVSEEVARGDTASTPKMTRQGPKTEAINRESWCAIEPCPDATSLLAPTQSPECENFLDVGLGEQCASKQGVLKRDSGSDSDLFHSPSEDVDRIIFSKPEEEQSVCDVTGSSSSTDDTASLDRPSSHGSDVSLPQISNLNSSSLKVSNLIFPSSKPLGGEDSRPFHNTSANLTESITEETYNFGPQSPSKKDFEGKSGTKVSRTFSYIKNKMSSSKKSKEKEKEKDKVKEKEKDAKEKEKDKKILNGHSFSSIPVVGPISCSQCSKPFSTKDAYTCANCSAFVHKGCRESLASCAKVKMKQPRGSLQAQDTSSLPTVIMRNKLGTDMNEGQLMGDFEVESRQLEAESWSRVVDSKFLKQQKKDVVKRQEVIYELMQTELHHVRTLKIMSDVYSRGMMTDLLFEQQMVEKLFPCLDELISIHSQFFQRILERKKESLVDKSEKNFLIKRIGDVLVNQFSGENADRLKKTYGKFCGHHNQSVNYFKDLYAKDKRFQAFVKKKMSSSVVRRLGVSECILLVTQRITKYPVLFQRILQYTKDNGVEQDDLAQSLSLVKDVIRAVDSEVASYEKKVRLNEIYTKTDSKSIMRMKSGQMFAKEDLKRKKLVRDGSVCLKNTAGRLKEVQAVLLTDILVFLQEKDQKYVFASLDQKSTVISLKKLIVREVAHEEKGLFLISMGVKDPEMVEVHAGSREERDSWIHVIQDTINTLNRDEDEGIPSENEEEKKMLDSKARELKEQLQQKDLQILLLLEEKEMIFRDMTECSTPLSEECSPTQSSRILFRSNTEEALKGGPLMRSAINEVEILQSLVSGNLGGALGPAVSSPGEQEGAVGPVSLPRRAETFGGFDSHQMSASKGGDKEEGDDGQDLRRTESDSGLKKGGNANLAFILKKNNEVVQSIVHLHELLSTLQQDLERDRDELQQQKGAYQCDLERLRAAQRQLERDQEQLKRQMERDACQVSQQHVKLLRIPSFLPSPEESPVPPAPSVAKSGSLDSELSLSPKRNSLSRTQKDKGPFHILSSTSQTSRAPEAPSPAPVSALSSSTRLFGLAKPKDKKEKKKKSKGGRSQAGDGPVSEVPPEGEEIFC